MPSTFSAQDIAGKHGAGQTCVRNYGSSTPSLVYIKYLFTATVPKPQTVNETNLAERGAACISAFKDHCSALAMQSHMSHQTKKSVIIYNKTFSGQFPVYKVSPPIEVHSVPWPIDTRRGVVQMI